MSSEALIIFVKNMVAGKVKTRLAATIGDTAVMQVYKKLVKHTYQVTQPLSCDKHVYYNAYVEQEDCWHKYKKALQQGNDLGEKMNFAFEQCFKQAYTPVIIIGSDCPELTTDIIQQAFNALQQYDVVVGPAADGGYYLIGMKHAHSQLFQQMQWSTASVCAETINRCKRLALTYVLLPLLHDVDEEKDLIYLRQEQ